MSSRPAAGHAAGREVILYHNALQWYQGLDVEVCLPVESAAAATPGVRQLAGGPAARAVYRGPWEADIWQAYATLLAADRAPRLRAVRARRASSTWSTSATPTTRRYVTESPGRCGGRCGAAACPRRRDCSVLTFAPGQRPTVEGDGPSTKREGRGADREGT